MEGTEEVEEGKGRGRHKERKREQGVTLAQSWGALDKWRKEGYGKRSVRLFMYDVTERGELDCCCTGR